MTDIVSPATRSRMMAGIKGKNSAPEMRVRSLLLAAGFRYRLHRRDLPGTPDIVMPGRKVAIFVHGCFWHAHEGCKYAKLPATRPEFWASKLRINVERDQRAVEQLMADGWRVLCVWECATRSHESVRSLPDRLLEWIHGISPYGEISGPAPK
jgi:DNA mismatch endonuclease (patch repair protein)